MGLRVFCCEGAGIRLWVEFVRRILKQRKPKLQKPAITIKIKPSSSRPGLDLQAIRVLAALRETFWGLRDAV